MRRDNSRPIDRPCTSIHRHALGLAIGAALVASISIEAQAQAFPPVMQLSSLDGTTGFRIDGVAAGDYSGRAVSAAGDVNGDGFDDLLIGAYGADPNGSLSGSSYVVFGMSNGQFCGIDIGFAPTAPGIGIRQATLRLDSNAPSSPDFVTLRGSNDVVFADGFEGD